MGEQANPGDSTSYLCPTSTATAVTGYLNGSLQDYMGLPTKVPGYVHNTFHLRAYNLIWNEWFRDQNMQNSVTVDKGDGPDNPAQYILQRRGKRHDYFTSALPFPQKGPAVQLPIGSSAQIYSNGLGIQMRTSADPTMRNLQNNHNVGTLQLTGLGAAQSNVNFGPAGGGVTGLYADLSSATAATINQLRQAFQIQRIYERDARGGTRYTELIQAHFGVTSPDARLQRPSILVVLLFRSMLILLLRRPAFRRSRLRKVIWPRWPRSM